MPKDKLQSQPPDKGFRDTDDVHVNAIHARIVAREQEEPEEGFEPTPWWVWTISVVLLFVMGFYLGRYSGSWSTVAHEVESPQVVSGQPITREVKGDLIYVGVCQTCHQPNGLGVAGQYPPLAGSEWVTRDKETPIRIVLHGLEGPISVRGNTYNNKMPAFYDKLSDDEIAAVVTYVRSSWGNDASGVNPEDVKTLRSQHGTRGVWSAAELLSSQTAQK
jgi:mono/diheme cytochrome c family protein